MQLMKLCESMSMKMLHFDDQTLWVSYTIYLCHQTSKFTLSIKVEECTKICVVYRSRRSRIEFQR